MTNRPILTFDGGLSCKRVGAAWRLELEEAQCSYATYHIYWPHNTSSSASFYNLSRHMLLHKPTAHISAIVTSLLVRD